LKLNYATGKAHKYRFLSEYMQDYKKRLCLPFPGTTPTHIEASATLQSVVASTGKTKKGPFYYEK
jgi:hypothetical protein